MTLYRGKENLKTDLNILNFGKMCTMAIIPGSFVGKKFKKYIGDQCFVKWDSYGHNRWYEKSK